MLKQLYTVFSDSLATFLIQDKYMLINDVAEQGLCTRLAIYLTDNLRKHRLDGYYADTEFNRKQNGEVKTILDEKMKVISIKSDLIVHSRGESIIDDNLITIEMKKAWRPETEKIDNRIRLRAMTKPITNSNFDNVWSTNGIAHPEHVCGYKLGIYIIIDRKRNCCILEYYQRGAQVDQGLVHF